jgi:hypothetical protein
MTRPTSDELLAVIRSVIDRQIETTPSGKELARLAPHELERLAGNIARNVAAAVDGVLDEVTNAY